METERIRLKTAVLAVIAILVVELLANALSNSTSVPPLAILGCLRILDSIILLGICSLLEPEGIRPIGIAGDRILSGCMKGFFWSAGFGLTILLIFGLMRLAGIQALDLIKADLPDGLSDILLFFFIGGIISPVAEEIFFRGVLFGYFRRWGMWAAILLSTVIFAAVHASRHSVPTTQLVGGLLFAFAYEKEKNIFVPITIHILGNLALFTLALIHLQAS